MKKVALITGAGTGIGAAIAKSLAAQDWKVVLCGRTESSLKSVAKEIREAGGEAQTQVCDVTDSSDVQALVKATGTRLDALIHSAGIGHCLTIDELDEQEWKDTLDVAATGAFLTAKYALPLLRSTDGRCGHIIQIGSLASGGTWELEVGYGTAKCAQVKFALHLDSYMKKEASAGGRVIHVHSVCPGTVDTPFWNRIPQRSADPELTLRADEVAWVVDRIIENPASNAETLEAIKPRRDVLMHRLSLFEKFDNVIAIKHESHP